MGNQDSQSLRDLLKATQLEVADAGLASKPSAQAPSLGLPAGLPLKDRDLHPTLPGPSAPQSHSLPAFGHLREHWKDRKR